MAQSVTHIIEVGPNLVALVKAVGVCFLFGAIAWFLFRSA